jgi:threonine-phosphate decarboxylase
MLERFGHGGDLLTASTLFNRSEDSFLDFSSNMNPFGPPPIVKTIFSERWSEVVRYPDPSVRRLRLKLASRYDISPDSILVGNGAAELIDLIVRHIRPLKTTVTAPSFGEYEDNARRVQSHVNYIPLEARQDFLLDLSTLKAGVDDTDLLILGHPNNPTGTLLPMEVLQFLEEYSKPIMLDEAFIDFLNDEHVFSQIRRAATHPRLYVVRSMTKFFAIPGLRLGFVVAHPDSIRKLKAMQVHWSVNHFAQCVGETVLDDVNYIRSTKDWVVTERTWFVEQLRTLGLRVFDSVTNYLLVSIPGNHPLDVQQLQVLMGKQGVLIRDASLFPGLSSKYFRLAVRLREQNEICLRCLQQSLALKEK